MGEVNVTFKEPVHRILDRIKHEPYFRWPNKIGGDPSRRNQNLYCTYHRDKGVIEVIHVAPEKLSAGRRKGVLMIVPVEGNPDLQLPGKKMKFAREPISFDNDDLEGMIQPHNDALVVMVRINGFLVKRVMVDQGSGADVMYPDLFRGLGLRKKDLMKHTSPLVGFDGKVVIPEGQISLPVIMGGKEVAVTFTIVSSFSSYTAILGRLWIHSMGAIPSTLHVKIKFPTKQGVTVIGGDQQAARQFLIAVVNWKWRNQVNQGETTGPLVRDKGTGRSEQEQVERENASRKVQVLLFLTQNIDVFAWNPYEVLGVDPGFIVHKLNVDPSYPPKKQKLRRSAKDHVEAIRREVEKLKEVGAIKETFFPEWLANTVVVRKKNGKWRVYMDFTNLNRACPKDPFPMPKIDQLVDATYRHLRMSFLDAFQGYHQIAPAAED
ncbi:uncharacterized protein LOC126700482 [Quercus robur]|uniref:uncharacterized protein LOC126700482 n=1 Tax=Quercus robur TaxID=38942 RepID=UPI00216254C9|nr:uncharacterized protein LOC126700482 [Quercus robur]